MRNAKLLTLAAAITAVALVALGKEQGDINNVGRKSLKPGGISSAPITRRPIFEAIVRWKQLIDDGADMQFQVGPGMFTIPAIWVMNPKTMSVSLGRGNTANYVRKAIRAAQADRVSG